MASITVTKKKQKQKIKEPQIKITWKEIKRQKNLLIWSANIKEKEVIYCYLPLGGWLMAFQNYKPKYTCHGCDQSGRHLCDCDCFCNFI